ncbi:defensin-like protein 1 [Vitis vinifera]|uniref:defensin-like protein 1 n=1 Tax=Vitis vinifera TaxID=29760 RepID=UPI00053FE9D9|nr:defensin-like protein 1 [Vitis vinifera]|eukprot:XP_002263380.3 PREDICTED: defensin-like protein 1 [Vitis vinifera]
MKHLEDLKFKKKKMTKKKEEAMEKKSPLGLTFLLLLLLMASQETEARLCESQSHWFRGVCVSNHNCAVVCRNEHFVGGRCRGFRRRCFCTRNC